MGPIGAERDGRGGFCVSRCRAPRRVHEPSIAADGRSRPGLERWSLLAPMPRPPEASAKTPRLDPRQMSVVRLQGVLAPAPLSGGVFSPDSAAFRRPRAVRASRRLVDGVIGSTADFGSVSPGSSPGRPVRVFPCGGAGWARGARGWCCRGCGAVGCVCVDSVLGRRREFSGAAR